MSSSSEGAESWITSFCARLGHEYFAIIGEDFIEEDFNLTGLSSQVPLYKEVLELILDVEPEDEYDDEDDEEVSDDDEDEILGTEGRIMRRDELKERTGRSHTMQEIDSYAELLYGLIHQRYITSRQGMAQMHEKYEAARFGICPRVHCNGAKVLPVGCSDTPGQDTVKLFCASCFDIYSPPNSRFHNVDGAFFGTTFPSLFFMTYPELQIAPVGRELPPLVTGDVDTAMSSPGPTVLPPFEINGVASSNFAPGLGTPRVYEPRIYGFRVSERAKTGPRMKWLRSKPEDLRELDEARAYKAAVRAGEVEMEDEGAGEVPDEEMAEVGRERDVDVVVETRKKAPLRRRRGRGSEGSVAGVLSSPNGVNGVG